MKSDCFYVVKLELIYGLIFCTIKRMINKNTISLVEVLAIFELTL